MVNDAKHLLSGDTRNLPVFEAAIDFAAPETELLDTVSGLLEADSQYRELGEAVVERWDRLEETDTGSLLLAASIGKPLINKFCVALGVGERGYKVWMHQYLPENSLPDDGPYVQGTHNQRYPLVSVILDGGYDAHEYRWLYERPPDIDATIADLSHWTDHMQRLTYQTKQYRTGDIMRLHTWEAHALYNIRPGTLTLAFELPAVRDFSVAFDGDDASATRIIYDLGYRLREFAGLPRDFQPTE